MAGVMAHIVYTSDDGVVRRIRMDASNAAAVGNVVSTDSTVPPLLGGMRPRYVLAQHPTNGHERKLVVGSVTNAIWTGVGGTVNLPDFNNGMAAVAYNLTGRVGERRYAR